MMRDPWQRVEVQLFIDGKLMGTQVAHHSRPDVSAAGWAKDEWHGYNFVVPGLATGTHEAQSLRAASKSQRRALHVAVVGRSDQV